MKNPDGGVVLSKCARTKKTYGMTFIKEKNRLGEYWELIWGFPISEAMAGREGYDKTEITGDIRFGAEYRGCPHCGSPSYVKCGTCHKISCWNGSDQTVHCPWCDTTSEIGGTIESLTMGGDV